jgi:hypothetical protein
MKTDVDLETLTSLGIYSTGSFTIDEIKVGTTYIDVMSPDTHPDFDDLLECIADDL